MHGASDVLFERWGTCFRPGRYNGMTDGAMLLADGLEKVRAFASDELTEEEAETIEAAISVLRRDIDRR
jgi:hypothetical protein